ncbi:MAG: hypothetical protein H0U18_02530 [Pyrinomonadaceae bacterium]|nr:hypothetical protein [Pyrinomonadaceae bacterium]
MERNFKYVALVIIAALIRRPHCRRGFALILTVLTGLGSPVSLVVGQSHDDSHAPSVSVSEQSLLALEKIGRNEDVFVIYRDEKGESVCRSATPDEKRSLLKRGKAGPTSTIYPGGKRPWKDEFNASAPAGTELGTPLLPSAGLRIVLHGTQQLQNNPTARDAFIVAANRWEALISTPITVVLDVDFGPTIFGEPFPNPSTLGSTSSFTRSSPLSTVRQQLINNAPRAEELQLYNALPATVPVELNGSTLSASQVRMTVTTARALGLSPDIPNPDAVPPNAGDAGIGFNSAHSFDFNPNDGITSGALDFDSVVVHEIGHALGFISNSGNGVPTPLSIWDLFRFRPGTASLGTIPTSPRVMSEGGDQIFFNNRTNSFGTMELGLSTGGSDGEGGDGAQSSHWKEDSGTNPFIGIMDPRLRSGRREVLTDNDLKALDTFGYTIGGTAPPPPPPPPPPANDNFAAAVLLNSSSGSVTGINVGATGEAGEPDHAGVTSSGRKSVWYTWTASGSGQTTFNTQGSSYDTILGIYTGGSVNALSLIGSNDDVDTNADLLYSSVTFAAGAGTTYRIAVDGFQGETGSITLNWTGPAPTPAPTPTPSGAVQFSAITATATETLNATTKLDLTVTRSDTSGAASVNYASSDGTANERSDYLAALGTLQFQAGEATKTIAVFIVDDSFGEGAETFNVTLSNALGVSLGAQATVTVTINSNEAVSGPNPVRDASFSSDFFVRQHYVDFFNREADAPGLGFWKNQIDECTTQACLEIRRINVSAAFFVSIEFQQTGYLVYKAYQAAFNSGEQLELRDSLPDTQEIGRGVIIGKPEAEQQLETNKQSFFNGFVQRPAFLAPTAYPTTLTAAQFVDKLNANTFDPRNRGAGALTQSERDALVAQLWPDPASPTLRAQVLRSVSENGLFTQRQFNKAFVLMQYFGYMRRNPDATPDTNFDGYNFWLTKLNQFNGNFVDAEMVKAFTTSGEYIQRFGP